MLDEISVDNIVLEKILFNEILTTVKISLIDATAADGASPARPTSRGVLH